MDSYYRIAGKFGGEKFGGEKFGKLTLFERLAKKFDESVDQPKAY